MRKALLLVLSLLLVGSVDAYLVTSFNDSTSSSDYFFNSSYLTETKYINLPKNASFSTATLKSNVTYNWIDNSFNSISPSYSNEIYTSKIIIDSNVNTHLIYTREYQPPNEPINYVISYTNVSSGSTTNIGEIGHAVNNQSFDAAIDSNNVIYVTWVYYNSTDDKQYLYVANSTNWNNKILVNISPYNTTEANNLDLAYPAITVDSNNMVHLVWEMYNGSSLQIYYANSSSGWIVNKISNESRNCHTPDVLVDSNGVVHVVFQDPVDDTVGTTSLSKDSSVSLAATCSSYGYSTTYYKYANSSSWPTSSTIVIGNTVPYCNLKFPKIAKDSNGKLYIAGWGYFPSYTSPVFYQELWNTSTRQSIGRGYSVQIGIDPENVIHLVYFNETGFNVTIANSSTSFSKLFKDDYVSSTSSDIPDVAISPNGGLFITYAKGTSVYFMRYGDLPNTTAIEVGSTDVLAKASEYKGSDTLNIASALSSYLSSCTPTNGNCTVPVNVTVGSAGRVKLTNLNISYGTQLIPATGITFKLSNGTDVSTNPQYEDAVIYAYNGSLLMSVNTSFRNQPNYTGWTGEAGVNATDNRAYVRVDALPSGAQNLSQKTIYLKWSNTSLSKVCVIDDASVTAAQLEAIVTEADCTNANGVVQTPSTIDIGGTTYFAITGTTNSGAVQVTATGNNPPVLSDGSVTPEVGSKYAFYTYTVTVTDPDNDSVTAKVYIDGTAYTMEEYDTTDTTTSDGKVFTYSYQFGVTGTHRYYFEASDGTATTTTVTYSGPTVGESLPISTAKAPGMSEVGVIVLFLMGMAFVVMKTRSG